MKNANVFFKLLAAVFMVTSLVQMAAAQPEYGRGHGNRGSERQEVCPRHEQCQQRIPELTEEQSKQISDLKTAYLKDIQPLESEIKINEAKIEALIIQDNPDVKELLRLVEENGKMRTEIRKKHVLHRLEIRKLLTDEQKVRFGQGAWPMHLWMHDRYCQ